MTYCSLTMIKYFVRKYLKYHFNEKINILEIGSYDDSDPSRELVFRRYFNYPGWNFIGMDIVPGQNVDVVSKDMYNYPFEDNSFDVVICGNTLEHVKDIYKVIKEIERITKDWVCIIVPNHHPLHRHPVDCWRFFPDGINFLLTKVANLKIIESKKSGKNNDETLTIARKIL